MKLPNSEHNSHPWRIHEIASDLALLDVWALPVEGGLDDFDALVTLVASSDPANADSLPARCLWRLRDRLGEWLGLGRIAAPVERRESDTSRPTMSVTNEDSLADRLPSELQGTAQEVRFRALPFVALYRTNLEFAAEISNRTVHGVMHLGWVEQRHGSYQGRMAVYVKPRGTFGEYYIKLIEPFRHLIVYPALMRQIGRTWASRGTDRVA